MTTDSAPADTLADRAVSTLQPRVLTDTGRGTREVGLVAKPPDMAEFFGMQALQVLITIVSILATGALLLRQKRRAAKWIRLRPRLDSVRIVVQLGSVIVIAALTGAGAPILALVLVGLFAVGPGYVQGRNLVIGDHDGKTYTIRNTLAASVWGAGRRNICYFFKTEERQRSAGWSH